MEQSTTKFPAPVKSYDVHVYFFGTNAKSTEAALQLRQETIEAFPQITVYPPQHKPVGPHPVAMWEADIFSPLDFGRYVAWLAPRHGDLSVLIHPNTGNDLEDHTVYALWLGQKLPLILDILRKPDDLYQ